MIHPQKPKHIFFDFWNTLMTTTMDREKGIKGLLALTDRGSEVTVGQALSVALELMHETKPFRAVRMEFSQRQFETNILARLGLSVKPEVGNLDVEFVKNALNPVPEPNLQNMLERLADRGITCSIVSNSVLSKPALSYILEMHDLEKHFQFIMTSTDYGFRKPHPQIYRSALAKAAVSAQEAWFIGDWIDHDVAGAQEAGICSVWYNTKDADNHGITPDIEISDLAKLIDFIE